jgi:hypothetical protein
MEPPPLPSSYGLTSGTFRVWLDPSNPVARPSSFVYAERDAHLFQTQFEDVVGAPLKMVKSYVLDTPKKSEGRAAHITIEPPLDRSARIGAPTKTRRINDRKKLNETGLVALARPSRTRETGVLWKGTTVWKMEFRCTGTTLCDAPPVLKCGCACTMKMLAYATVQDVSNGEVVIEVSGCDPTVSGSLHSATRPWEMGLQQQLATQHAPTWLAMAKRESAGVDQLRHQIIAQQRQDGRERTDPDPAVASSQVPSVVSTRPTLFVIAFCLSFWVCQSV